MSRVAKAPINIPKSVECSLLEGHISIKGPKGTLQHQHNKHVEVSYSKDDAKLMIKPIVDDLNAWALAGTTRAILNNIIIGVTEGFTETLELIGVGYRAQATNKKLSLSLGYSHPIEYDLPENVIAETPNNTTIVLKGIDKQLVAQVAAEVRSYRRPEPYKGKGIKYLNEIIQRKEAKKK